MRLQAIAAYLAVCAFQLTAQTGIPWDTSGDSMLKGAYSFREVALVPADAYGDIGRALTVWGTITFDGNGVYNVTGQLRDSNYTPLQPFSASGSYGISASGWGYIQSLLSSNEVITGLVSQGTFIGSDTNSLSLRDFFMAVPAAPASADSSLLSGNYWIATLNFPSADPGQARDGLSLISADGKGGMPATISMSGYVGLSGSTPVTQSIQGAGYTFANGVATLSFPAGNTAVNQTLISGDKLTYVSADGNFLVGGSTGSYDILIGVRSGTNPVDATALRGLYYLAGLDDDESLLPTQGYAQLYNYYGSMNADGNGGLLQHREVSPFDSRTYDYMTNGLYKSNSDGSFSLSSYTVRAASGAGALVGIGQGPLIGIVAALRSPSFTGSGVYLNPTGVVNAASSAPFTSGVVRGEFLTLYGTNLAPSVATAQVPFPATVNGVQVMINGRPAPVYYVSPTQVSAIVPYATELSNAQIQVINNGTTSNTVTSLVKAASPGLFTNPPGGTGYGALLHADFSVVTTDHPAKAGETVLVYLTGLGDVSPAVSEGTAAPSSPTSNVASPLAVYFTGGSTSNKGTVSYAGLAPGFAGLYQINVQIPATLASGDYYVEVATPGAYASQALIPVR
jgi:uncharacterized protein (TIGR03437 family)